jgi:hypothetical protein
VSGRRWPIEPLDEALRRRLGPPPAPGEDPLVGYSAANAAAVLGIATRNWLRYRAAGEVSELVADRFACRLALNPIEVWPDWHDALGYALEDLVAS